MAIPEHHKENFKTLTRAFEAGRAAIMECTRKSDGKVVALLCAVGTDEEGLYAFTPLAEMMDGNPFELYEPPLPTKGGGAPTGEG